MPRPPSPTTPSFSISPLDAVNPEGDTGTTVFTFTVTRTSGKGAARVNYAVTGVQADDFTGGLFPSGTIFFRNGESSITITIPIAGDIFVEPDEIFTVTLSNPVGGTIATGTATGTIQNDDFVAIQRVSVDSTGGQGNGRSFLPSISADGRRRTPISNRPVAPDRYVWFPGVAGLERRRRRRSSVRCLDSAAAFAKCS